MTVTQLLWGLISFLFVISFFFVRYWLINNEKNLDKKMDKDVCEVLHKDVRGRTNTLFKHEHASSGEVIIK